MTGAENPASVLLLKPGSLGDVVHALPCAAAVRQTWPGAHISWVVDPRWAEVLDDNPDVDRRILFPREKFSGLRGGVAFRQWLRGLRFLEPDLVIDLQGLLRSGLMCRASRGGHRVGGSDAREGARLFYDETIRVDRPLHAADRYRQISTGAGAVFSKGMIFPLPPGTPPNLSPPTPFILLHPFSRGKSKSLGLGEVAALCEFLAPARVVLVGGAHEAPEKLGAHVINLLGATSLLQLIWLIRRAEFIVSVDSGPAHLAAAVTDRLLAIHTWSDPRRVGPYNRDAFIWQGGVIRRQEPSPGAELAPPRRPSPEDIEAIAEWVLRRLGETG